jgi:hypothetical protein
MRRVAIAALSLALVACASAGTGETDASGQPIDAPAADGPEQGRADADPNLPDAQMHPDAEVDAPVPDAMPMPPDARPPDAAPMTPDAHPVDAAPMLPDARPPDAALPPDACVPITVNLLQNPGFDQGPGIAWSESNTGGFSTLFVTTADLPLAVSPQAGTYAIWMGGYEPANDQLFETVNIPAGTTALRFKGYRWIASADTATNADLLVMQIRDSGGSVLEQLAQFSNLNTNTNWTFFDVQAASPHAGQTIQIYLHATNNAVTNTNTNFFLDTFALEATYCP